MKAICTGCGVEVEFEAEKRGLMEKCDQCGEIFPLQPIKGPRASKDPIPARVAPARMYLRRVRAESNYDELRTLVLMIGWSLKGASVLGAMVALLIVYQLYSVATTGLVEWTQALAVKGPIPIETAQMLSRAQHLADIGAVMIGIFSVAYIVGFGFFIATVIHQSFSVGIDIADMTAEQGARSEDIG